MLAAAKVMWLSKRAKGNRKLIKQNLKTRLLPEKQDFRWWANKKKIIWKIEGLIHFQIVGKANNPNMIFKEKAKNSKN